VIAEFKGNFSSSYDFADHYKASGKDFDYTWEERWVRDEGYAKIIPETINGFLNKYSMKIEDFDKIIFPCYFKREHKNIAKKIGADPAKVQDNMHEVCGDTGTAHPLVMFVAALEEAKPGDKLLLASFGQGCDVLAFEVTDKINDFKGPQGIKGSLANRAELNNYPQYSKFRDMIPIDMGIRSESNSNTSLSTLWRNRKMILGLVGGKCKKCGTIQFPATPMCVNPDCNAMDEMEDYEFADKSGKIIMYTGDMLSATVNPPAVYGAVRFDGGGRIFADFTDCVLDQVKVGLPVKMSFRRKYKDGLRGISGYFWKAVPQVTE